MNHKQAWEATLGQLQMEMPKSNYDTYIKPTMLVSFEEDSSTFVIGIPTQYGRDWLEDRLTTIVNRILSGMMNCNSSVKFIVIEPDYELSDEPVDNKTHLQSDIISHQNQGDFRFTITSDSLRQSLIEPNVVMKIPTYLTRWCPYVELEILSIFSGLHQLAYLKHIQNPNTLLFSASSNEIAYWSGIGKNLFFQTLLNPNIKPFFSYSSSDGQKTKSFYKINHLPPITPADIKSIIEVLISYDIENQPVNALSIVNEIPIKFLLKFPTPLSQEEFNVSNYVPFYDQVISLINDEQAKSLAKPLILSLYSKIVDGFLQIPWYFVHNVVPSLGQNITWLYYWSMAQTYKDWYSGNDRDTFWTDYETMGQVAHVRTRTIQTWFPSTRPNKKNKLNHTALSEKVKQSVQKVQTDVGKLIRLERVDYLTGDQTRCALQLVRTIPLCEADENSIDMLKPIIENQQLMEELSVTIENYLKNHSINSLESLLKTSKNNHKSLLRTSNNNSKSLLRTSNINDTSLLRTSDINDNSLLETSTTGNDTLLETSISLLQTSESLSETSKQVLESLSQTSLNILLKYVFQILIKDTNTSARNNSNLKQYSTPKRGGRSSWSLERIIKRLPPNLKDATKNQPHFISWLLFSFTTGATVPVVMAAKKCLTAESGAGGVFDELASFGPEFLKDIIDNKYSDSTSKYSTIVISKISRMDELCDLLCLDVKGF